jgi:hypothetical protein
MKKPRPRPKADRGFVSADLALLMLAALTLLVGLRRLIRLRGLRGLRLRGLLGLLRLIGIRCHGYDPFVSERSAATARRVSGPGEPSIWPA